MSRPQLGAARATAGALALPKDGEMAQNRNYNRVGLADLPEPVDVGDKTGPLDFTEAQLLGLCERAMVEHVVSEVVCAKAMANLRDRRLYRVTHATFEAYVAEHFARGRQWAYREIERYMVAQALASPPAVPALSPGGDTDALSPGGDTRPPLELPPSKHARELAPTILKYGAEAGREQYERAEATGRVTGTSLRKARKEIEAEREPEPEPDPEDEVYDVEIVEDEAPEDEPELTVPEIQAMMRRIVRDLERKKPVRTEDADGDIDEVALGALRASSAARTYSKACRELDAAP